MGSVSVTERRPAKTPTPTDHSRNVPKILKVRECSCNSGGGGMEYLRTPSQKVKPSHSLGCSKKLLMLENVKCAFFSSKISALNNRIPPQKLVIPKSDAVP